MMVVIDTVEAAFQFGFNLDSPPFGDFSVKFMAISQLRSIVSCLDFSLF